MRVLALEPYYTGSHRAFFDNWSAVSEHEWTILGLPGYKWKWRMRHAPVTLAEETASRIRNRERWDVVFCSDMLNLAEWRGLVRRELADLPSVVYFHENQLTYPDPSSEKRDYHFAMTNLTTALAADQVWFNSGFHRNSFLSAIRTFLGRMPDYKLPDTVDKIESKSSVQYPCINPVAPPAAREPGPLRILWAARWEHDKNPEDFFETLFQLQAAGIPFEVSVIGEQFGSTPGVFEPARNRLGRHVRRWGYQESRKAYESALAEADVIVSTAVHEFFGISVVEAVSCGVYPLLPNRLAYPEIFTGDQWGRCFYDGTVPALVQRLTALADELDDTSGLPGRKQRVQEISGQFAWKEHVGRLDTLLRELRD